MAPHVLAFHFTGNAINMSQLKSMPCSGLVLHRPNQNNLVLATRGYGDNFKLSFNRCRLNSCSTAKPTPSLHPSNSFRVRRCQAKSEDTEGILSDESIIMDEKILEQDLQIAIEEENYARAARIRDSLRHLHEDREASVLAANARFYNSFRNGDLAAMQTLWAKHDNVCCVHPGASGICSYDLVIESWEFVLADYEFPLEIELKDVKVHIRGDVGYVTCLEFVKTKGSSWGKQFATNVFERIDGQWFISIHHAAPVDL